MRSCCPAVLTGVQRSQRLESETDTQQGCASTFFLPPPPHPSIFGVASRHLSPPSLFVTRRLSLSVLFLLTTQTTLLSFILFVICQSAHPSLFLSVSDRQIDNGTAAQSGVRAFSYQQHAWDSSHCLACFHMTPRKLK